LSNYNYKMKELNTLEEIKEEVKHCPFCGLQNSVEFKSEIRSHIVKEKIMIGEFYFFKCSSCSEQFTTLNSDELSIKNFKHKVK
jgi:transposase-like protein